MTYAYACRCHPQSLSASGATLRKVACSFGSTMTWPAVVWPSKRTLLPFENIPSSPGASLEAQAGRAQNALEVSMPIMRRHPTISSPTDSNGVSPARAVSPVFRFGSIKIYQRANVASIAIAVHRKQLQHPMHVVAPPVVHF